MLCALIVHTAALTSQKLKIICGKLFWAFAKYYSHENFRYHVQWYACLVCTLATQVIVILPTNRKDRYDAIKKVCCVENPGEICVLDLPQTNICVLDLPQTNICVLMLMYDLPQTIICLVNQAKSMAVG